MRHFRYLEPTGEDCSGPAKVVTMSEEEILATHYDYWQGEMRKAGMADQISPESCIDDFIVVNWAWEARPCPDCGQITCSGSPDFNEDHL